MNGASRFERWARGEDEHYDIPIEGPMRCPWERAVDQIDWAFGIALAAWLALVMARACFG